MLTCKEVRTKLMDSLYLMLSHLSASLLGFACTSPPPKEKVFETFNPTNV